MTEPTPFQPGDSSQPGESANPGDSSQPIEPSQAVEPVHPVERLFPFVLKTRSLVAGRNALRANKGKLHFVLITTDIGEANRDEVLNDFKHYPVVQYFAAADLERLFHVKGAKAIGFMKSGLAQSIYAELKEHRINRPFVPVKPPESPPTPPSGHKAS